MDGLFTLHVASRASHFTAKFRVTASDTVLDVKELVARESEGHIAVHRQRMLRVRSQNERNAGGGGCCAAKRVALVDVATLAESDIRSGSELVVLERKACLPRPPHATNWGQVIFRMWDDSESSVAGQLISIGILILIIASCAGFILETSSIFQTQERTLVVAPPWNVTEWIGGLDGGAVASVAPLFAAHKLTSMRWVRALDSRLLKDMGIVSVRDRAVLMRAIAALDPHDGAKATYVYEEPTPAPFFFWLEVFCMAFFTLEYVARFATVPFTPWSHVAADDDDDGDDDDDDDGGAMEGVDADGTIGSSVEEEEANSWGALLDISELGSWERKLCAVRVRKILHKCFRRPVRAGHRGELACADFVCGVVPAKESACFAKLCRPVALAKLGLLGDHLQELPVWAPFATSARRGSLLRSLLCDGTEFTIHAIVKTSVFVTDPLNLIDLIAILPFYITLVGGAGAGGLAVLRVLRLSRVFRVLKLGKYSRSLHAFARVIRKSFNALAVLVLFMLLTMVLCGSLIYFAERGEFDSTTGKYMRPNIMNNGLEETPFKSIPFGFWWVIVSITTVGYGDFVPTTGMGKVVGVVTVFIGILTLAMPITVIGSNFSQDFIEHSEDYKAFSGDFGKVKSKRQKAKEGGGSGEGQHSGVGGGASIVPLSSPNAIAAAAREVKHIMKGN